MQFYSFSISLYITLVVDKLNGLGPSNTAHRERLPEKAKVMQD